AGTATVRRGPRAEGARLVRFRARAARRCRGSGCRLARGRAGRLILLLAGSPLVSIKGDSGDGGDVGDNRFWINFLPASAISPVVLRSRRILPISSIPTIPLDGPGRAGSHEGNAGTPLALIPRNINQLHPQTGARHVET